MTSSGLGLDDRVGGAVTVFTVFGLGEAGSLIASDLAALGHEVRSYDPKAVPTPDGVVRFDDPAAAAVGALAVLGITAAADAPSALAQALDDMDSAMLYADFSTGSPELKRELAAVAVGQGVAFVDVALMSTVPGKGVRTPALASGPGAERFVGLFAPLGMPLECVGDEPGVAATRKLLRSVVVKGLAGLLIESMRAANEAGLAEETWANLVEQCAAMDAAFLRHLVVGTAQHADRRLHEMEATEVLLTELGVDPLMTRGTIEHLRRTPTEGLPELPD